MKYSKRKDRYCCNVLNDNFHEIDDRLKDLEENGGSGGGGSGKDGVSILSVEQTTTSTEDGGTNVITCTLSDGTESNFNIRNGNRGSDGKDGLDGVDGKSAYQYAREGGYDGTELEFAEKMAEDVDVDIDYSKLEFDTEEIVVKDPVDKILSHVGMIIHSTTLDTMEKVIEIYGGTTWVKIEGRFLLGQSSTYAINSTGGAATHTLSVNEMPSHNHEEVTIAGHYMTVWSDRNTKGGGAFNMGGLFESNGNNNNTFVVGNKGGSQPHNNMPPYKTVYIWERTE